MTIQRITVPTAKQMLRDGAKLDNTMVLCGFVAEKAPVQEGTEEDRTLPFILSTSTVDRDNDTINVDGWKLEAYRKNPVMLWAHNTGGFPIGKSLSTWVEQLALRSVSRFTAREENPEGFMAYKLYQAGILNAVSVGFKPLKYLQNQERGEWALDFLEQELLEFSGVPIPSNPDALQQLKGIDIKPMREWVSKILDDRSQLVLPAGYADQLEATWKAIAPPAGAVHLKLKKAIPYKRTPLADEDTAWDGPAVIAAASAEQLGIICTWMDPEGDAESKATYKLPHHTVETGYPCVWKGVVAAMSALLGGRGGVAIPEDDRKAVYNHLAKHYADFDKEPPEFKSAEPPAAELAIEANKAGRVLSSANEQALRNALEAIAAVLAKLEPAEESPAAPLTNKSNVVEVDGLEIEGLINDVDSVSDAVLQAYVNLKAD